MVLERTIVARDRNCVYCGTSFEGAAASRGGRPSWEHIVNDARIVTAESIALCCIACNSSKGAKDLTVWLGTKYCVSRGITERTVAAVVQAALVRSEGRPLPPPTSGRDLANKMQHVA